MLDDQKVVIHWWKYPMIIHFISYKKIHACHIILHLYPNITAIVIIAIVWLLLLLNCCHCCLQKHYWITTTTTTTTVISIFFCISKKYIRIQSYSILFNPIQSYSILFNPIQSYSILFILFIPKTSLAALNPHRASSASPGWWRKPSPCARGCRHLDRCGDLIASKRNGIS